MQQPLSLAGTPAASPLGYFSWAFGQAARDPFYIMVVIYIFFRTSAAEWSEIRLKANPSSAI